MNIQYITLIISIVALIIAVIAHFRMPKWNEINVKIASTEADMMIQNMQLRNRMDKIESDLITSTQEPLVVELKSNDTLRFVKGYIENGKVVFLWEYDVL